MGLGLLFTPPALAAKRQARNKTSAARQQKQAEALAAGRREQEKAARTACLAGDYCTGVDILAELFVDTKDSTHVFNQGRCFE